MHAAEQEATRVTAEVQSKAAQRAVEIVAAAQADADRLRQEATRRVDDYLAASRRRIDLYTAGRLERLAELTEGLIEAGESLHHRLHSAIAIRDQLHSVIQAIGCVAETVAREAAQPPPPLPPLTEAAAPAPQFGAEWVAARGAAPAGPRPSGAGPVTGATTPGAIAHEHHASGDPLAGAATLPGAVPAARRDADMDVEASEEPVEDVDLVEGDAHSAGAQGEARPDGLEEQRS